MDVIYQTFSEKKRNRKNDLLVSLRGDDIVLGRRYEVPRTEMPM